MTAGIGPDGTPNASMGTKAPEVAELLADSGPATPSIAPCPKRSGYLESRRSTAYETKDAMMCAEPGMMPIKKPRTVPRPMGQSEARHSSRDGKSSFNRGFLI